MSLNCTIDIGYNWTTRSTDIFSTWTEICGDGIEVGNEFWDDDDTPNEDKCNSEWNGNPRGWNCVGGNTINTSNCEETTTVLAGSQYNRTTYG